MGKEETMRREELYRCIGLPDAVREELMHYWSLHQSVMDEALSRQLMDRKTWDNAFANL